VNHYEYRVVNKQGQPVLHADPPKPLLDVEIARAGVRWLDYTYPGLGPHRAQRRLYVASDWQSVDDDRLVAPTLGRGEFIRPDPRGGPGATVDR
jgi:hypothetical protein